MARQRTDAVFKEALGVLVSKMDIKAIQTKVGTNSTSEFLSGLSLRDAVQKLMTIGEKTGITKLADKGVSLASGAYLDSVIRSSSGLSTILASYKKHIMSLQTNVKSLMEVSSTLGETSGLASSLSGSNTSAPPLAVPITTSHPRVALLQRMEERIAFLEKQTAAKQTVGNSTTAQLQGQLFNCQQDMENYGASLIGSSAVSVPLVNDCYTLLQSVILPIQGDSIDIREIHSIDQMGSNIRSEAADVRNAIARNQNGRTSVFTGNSVGAKHQLKGIPTYGFWGKPSSVDGYKCCALNQLDCIVSAIYTDLNCRVPNSELRGFLKAMLTRSQEIVRSLFDYITNSYPKLIESFTDSDQTWDFVNHCVEHIFSHDFDVARSILRGHDLKVSGFSE